MAGLADFNKPKTHFQDYANLVLGALLFLSPWALGYADVEMAARTSWAGGLIIAILSLAAIINFAEWEEWLNLLIGLAVIVSPYFFGFDNVKNAVAAHYVIGVLVAVSSGWELWSVHHHPTPRMM
jgi:hypothetical protein